MGTRFAGFVAVVALLVGGIWLALGGAGFQWVRGVEQSKGPFFRVDVKLKYKGEPLDISFEVACSARITSYADNSQSYEVGLTPNLYGLRMKDNQAVVVRPPTACNGEVSGPLPKKNLDDKVGDIPPGFMPVIIVYENADTLAFGKAYLADDAYEGPKSELTFLGATVTSSNFENWKKFRETGPKNVVTPERWYTTVGLGSPPTIGTYCYFANKVMFDEEIRAKVRALPSYKANSYWATKDHEEQKSMNEVLRLGALSPSLHTEYDTKSTSRNDTYGSLSNDKYGVERRKIPSRMGVGRSPWNPGRVTGIYPLRSAVMSRDLPLDAGKLEAFFKSLETNPINMIEMDGIKNRGFGYCFSSSNPITAERMLELQNLEPREERLSAFDKKILAFRGFMTIDGARVANSDPDNYSYFGHGDTIVYGDQFFLETDGFGLESTGGSV